MVTSGCKANISCQVRRSSVGIRPSSLSLFCRSTSRMSYQRPPMGMPPMPPYQGYGFPVGKCQLENREPRWQCSSTLQRRDDLTLARCAHDFSSICRHDAHGDAWHGNDGRSKSCYDSLRLFFSFLWKRSEKQKGCVTRIDHHTHMSSCWLTT